MIFAIFTEVCHVFYHFLPWFSTVPTYAVSMVWPYCEWQSCFTHQSFLHWKAICDLDVIVVRERPMWTSVIEHR